ncbi:MAG: shikimate dehydrogenase [Oscillospiraceae bacterium]|nr:shikimate dehydrogenase [Oscillospiraceae bacterium]
MKNQKFAVVGHPIGHTLSPFVHKLLFEIAGISAIYTVVDILPENFESEFSRLTKELDGFNVTIPYKTQAARLAERLVGKAELCGAVNTIKTDDEITGYTTDPAGFIKALEQAEISAAGDVLLLGAGGVSRTIAYELASFGVKLTIAVRPSGLEKAKLLVSDLAVDCPELPVSVILLEEITGDYDLLINGTSSGMYPNVDEMPVSAEVLRRCRTVFDAVYNPVDTKLLRTASELGLKTANGLAMLVWQAAASQELWLGIQPFNRENVAAVIAAAAEELNRRFG